MKELHIIPHSHLDREWYMSFEQHRARLVELMDALIELMESNEEYTYFHLDGQFIVIEDYLQIKPYMRERLYKLIREDRIQIGPWYVLQDEFLTSGEANVRNMLYGLKLCREIGADPVMIGYFPDSFGNISQAPQILHGFDIDKAVFGRGVQEVAADNMVKDTDIKRPSELIWESPDGSRVTSVLFCNWYHNAMEIPTEKEKAKETFERIIRNTEKCALTPHLLGMNGCDHEPLQVDLTEAIKAAEDTIKDIKIHQSNFKAYFEAIQPYADRFPVVKGELTDQTSSGNWLLADTASTHVWLKQKNHQAQNLLEQVAEPMNLLSFFKGDTYRSDNLLYAWKKLMENHPHDSICTCSSDFVAAEMGVRFDKSMEAARFVRDEARDFILKNIHTDHNKNLVVFHTSPLKTTALVKTYLDFDEDEKIGGITIYDKDGNIVPSAYKVLGRTFTYTLPKDKFRQVRWTNRVEVTMVVSAEGVGYSTYSVKTDATIPSSGEEIRIWNQGAENETISLQIEENGSLTVTDKESGRTYTDMNIFEDAGDMGNGYNFVETEGSERITTKNVKAKVSIQEKTPFSVTFRIQQNLEIPEGLDGKKRSAETKPFVIDTFVTMTAGIKRLDLKVKYNNASENHRLRALFTPDIQTKTVLADGQFDLVERPIQPWEGWTNPANMQRHQSFFALEDSKEGVLVAGRGLHSYEVLRDGKNTMALVLLRAVGEIGDWGIFPAPMMQCKGEQEVSYSIVPYLTEEKAEAYALGRSFSAERFVIKDVDKQEGCLPENQMLVKALGEHVSVSAVKKAENGNGMILRIYNTDTQAHEALVMAEKSFTKAYLVNMDERRLGELAMEEDGSVKVDLGAKKIVTIELA